MIIIINEKVFIFIIIKNNNIFFIFLNTSIYIFL